MKPFNFTAAFLLLSIVCPPDAHCQTNQASGETPSASRDADQKLVFKKIADIATDGKTDFKNAAINLFDGQTALVVSQYSGENQFLFVDPRRNAAEIVPLPGWDYPIPVSVSTRVLAGKDGTVGLLEPLKQVNVVANLPHVMEFGDLMLPAVSPDGAFICTRPTYDHIQLFDGKTGEPISSPIKQAGRILKMWFTRDSKYLCTCADNKIIEDKPERWFPVPKVNTGDDGLRLWDPSTGDLVAGPLGFGIDFRYIGSAGSYEPIGERIVTVNNSEFDERPLASKLRVYSVKTGALDVTIQVPSHISDVRWIDGSHLLVLGRRLESTSDKFSGIYDSHPLFVADLAATDPEVIEVAAETGFDSANAPSGEYFAANVRTPDGSFASCWKVGQPKPIWSQRGRFVAFGDQDWLVMVAPSGAIEVCEASTGKVVFVREGFSEPRVNRSEVWLFKDAGFEVWQAVMGDN